MPLLDQYPRVELARIRVPEDRQRQRERGEDGRVRTDHVQASIARLGVLIPLLVEIDGQDGPDPAWRLVFGECRLQSCLNLVAAGKLVSDSGQDLTTVPVRLASDLTPLESSLFELTENVQRKDLDWRDRVTSVAGIHRLCQAGDHEWTLGETAEVVSLSSGAISMYLRVQASLDDPRVADCTTVREAYNVLTRRDARALGDAIDQLAASPQFVEPDQLPEHIHTVTELRDGVESTHLVIHGSGPEPRIVPLVRTESGKLLMPAEALAKPSQAPSESILCADFREWAPQWNGQPFNLIHCDFPYEIDPFAGPRGRTGEGAGVSPYENSRDVYYELLEALCVNLDRLMSLSGHLVFWFSDRHQADGSSETRRLFRQLAPDLEFTPFPLIWHKSDGKGIAADARRHPRHTYETALLASRGKRLTLLTKDDVYAAPTDRSLHASTKPEPMLRHFLSMLADGNTRMLDPTCGSGSSLRAAESLGALVLGLEVDPEAAGVARRALAEFRTKRELAKASVEAL